jgi:hypothetical protein
MAAKGEVGGQRGKRLSLGVLLGSGFLLALAALAVWGLVVTWNFAGDVKISIHGYIAMALGVVGTIFMAGGLIWLAYYSARKGYDQPHDEP